MLQHSDARTLTPTAQGEKRRIAMTMRESGASFSAIGLTLGVHCMAVSMWWGFTAQRPIKRAYEQRPETIAVSLKTEYPRIKRRAVAERAEIHWGDETSLSSSDSRGRGFAPRGKTPVRTIRSPRCSVSFLSTVSNAGTRRSMVLTKAIYARMQITFFTRLCRDAEKKVFVILNKLNVHKARDVRDWIAAHADDIAMFYLPPYAPELNPDEYLNGDLKVSVAQRAPARNRADLLRTATSRLRSLQRQPERVEKFFQHPRVQYAA